MPKASVNGIDLYYESYGEGPVVVFAHGRGGNHLSWWQQVPVFSKNYRCITFDHRGFGQSLDKPGGPGRKAFVEDLRALLDHLRIRETFLVAQSMGGLTCLGFAAKYPERTRGLVLADTTGGINDMEVVAKLSDRDTPSDPLQRALSRGFIERDPARSFLYREIGHLNPWLPPEPMSILIDPDGPKALELARLKVPTLLIVGREDILVSPEVMVLVQRLIPGSRLEIVPDAAHSVYFEQPEVFNRLVLAFFSQVMAKEKAVTADG